MGGAERERSCAVWQEPTGGLRRVEKGGVGVGAVPFPARFCIPFPSLPACLQSVLRQLHDLERLAACFAPIHQSDSQRYNASEPEKQAMQAAMERLRQLATAAGMAFDISTSLAEWP